MQIWRNHSTALKPSVAPHKEDQVRARHAEPSMVLSWLLPAYLSALSATSLSNRLQSSNFFMPLLLHIIFAGNTLLLCLSTKITHSSFIPCSNALFSLKPSLSHCHPWTTRELIPLLSLLLHVVQSSHLLFTCLFCLLDWKLLGAGIIYSFFNLQQCLPLMWYPDVNCTVD